MNLASIITFSLYLIGMLAIGIWSYKRTDNLSDYILGGRKMGPAVTALSVGASDMSGWLLLGLPGAVYLRGISEVWLGIGLLIGAWLNWLFVARRLRIFTELSGDALTIPDFFEQRFNDTSGALKVIASITIILFFTIYASSGMVGGALLFEEVFGLDYQVALLVGSVIIIAYTFVGGFLAVSWTDFVQGCLMLLALLLVPTVVFQSVEVANNPTLPASFTQLWHSDTTIIGVVSLLAWGLGYFGQPHILSRFMAIGSVDDLKLSRRIAMSWMLLSLVGALATGLAGAYYFMDAPIANPETIFIVLSNTLFTPWIAGLLVAAILSAIMSTIDSQLLVCSSVITEDLFKKFGGAKASNETQMKIGRISVLVIAAVAVAFAMDPKSNVLGLVSYAWAGFGAAFGPVILLSLYWKNYSRLGALTSIIVGAATVVIWKQLEGGIFDLYEILPGFVFAALAGVIASKFDKPNTELFKQFSQKL